MFMSPPPAVPEAGAGPAAYRQYARDWLRSHLPAHMRADSLDYRTPTLDACRDWEAAMYRAGLAGMTWPRAYGGLGLTLREHLVVNKEIGALPMPESVSSIGKELAGPIIQAVGTEAQKQALLPRILAMEHYWCQGFSEPDAGSDLARLRTRAVPEGDTWRINGQKIWTSGAQHSQWGLLITRTNPDAPKHKGLTMFFLSMSTPGVEIRPIKQANGQSGFNEVYFTDVRIPDDQRLGAVGQGWEVSLTTLMNERLSIGSGMSTGFPELFEYCLDAEIDGRPAVDDASVRSRLAQLAVKQSGLKYTGMRAITALSKGETPGPENSIGKLVAGATMQELAMFALDLQGQSGVIQDETSPMNARFQQMLLRSPATRIEGGSDEILRNIIGERVLGLPGDIRVDKDVAFRDIPTSGRK